MPIVVIILAILALITAISPERGEAVETRITTFIEAACPTATRVIIAAGGVADAWAQMKTGDPNATVDVLPADWIQTGRELCDYYTRPDVVEAVAPVE